MVQRQLMMQRAESEVPKADVVVSNPTELAIAIQYDPMTMPAPIVVAKGAGVLAQKIRRLALENGIPVVERKPLAQVLYKTVDVGDIIPADHYQAVAEVLRYVYRLGQGDSAAAGCPGDFPDLLFRYGDELNCVGTDYFGLMGKMRYGWSFLQS